MRRRVAIVLPPKEGFSATAAGAVALVVRDLARAPSAFDVTVLGLAPAGAPIPGVAFQPVTPRLALADAAGRYARGAAAALLADPPAVIEVHNRPDVALALARRLPSSRVMLFLHNDPHGMRLARRAADRAALLRRLAGIGTVSEYIAARFNHGLPPGAGAVALPNGLDLDALPAPAVVRDRVVLFASRVVADKGADVFVDAWAQSGLAAAGWQAVMIGADRFRPDSPETPFLAALRPRAAAAGIAMTGYLPNDQTLARLARSAIAVLPSRWPDPYPRAAQEALACGAALVATPVGGVPEIVGDAARVVPPGDAGALAGALGGLATDDAARDALAEAGLRRARGMFGMGPAVARWDAMRQRVLAR